MVRINTQRKESAVRALVPLQVRVGGCVVERRRDSVGVGGRNAQSEGRLRSDGGAGELDADRAVAGGGVIARNAVVFGQGTSRGFGIRLGTHFTVSLGSIRGAVS